MPILTSCVFSNSIMQVYPQHLKLEDEAASSTTHSHHCLATSDWLAFTDRW